LHPDVNERQENGMKRSTMFLCIALAMVFTVNALAEQAPRYMRSGGAPLFAEGADPSKAGRDTFVLIGPWGSGAQANGQFQDQTGSAAWNGWTHWDMTQPTESNWQVSDYNASALGADPQAGNLAAWCGDISFEPCNPEDPVGGYGNNWNDILDFFWTVDNPAVGVTVGFSAYANFDSEPSFDATTINYESSDGMQQVAYYDGLQTNVFIDETFTLSAADYVGPGADQVHITIQFRSDGGWSDADCSYATAGAVQVDDITVTLDQGAGTVTSFTDFESGWGDWAPGLANGVGDFTALWTSLEDIDPCGSNYSPQVAFIDDGIKVPGTGPSLCIDWCYGPGGYIVNTTGGLAGPDSHLLNALESPVLTWPGVDVDGAWLRFDVYRHEDLSADSPGMFYNFGVRSTDSSDPADIESANWVDRNGVYYGGPDYFRENFPISDLMVSGRQYAQIQLTCWELGYVWGWEGNDGYPAPYFDNVRFIAYPRTGPAMSTNELRLANDNFPAIGEVLFNDLGMNSVRFDAAQNIALSTDNVNVPGDSITFDIAPVRAGAEFVSDPELHWVMMQNPLFNEFRTNPEYGAASSGVSVGVPAVGSSGMPTPGVWAFDLPDENFFFPGDVIHYYISATDAVDGAAEQTSTLPVNLDGYGDFSGPLAYSSTFTVRALPSIYDDPLNPGTLVTPKTLFWNDFANRGGEEEWHGALGNLGFVSGVDYDTYYTNRPDSGVGNGLGGRATVFSLLNYDNMLYSCGDMTIATMSNGDFNNDPSNDIGVVDSWLRLGDKNMFLTGDDLVSDLMQSGPATIQFVQDWFKVSYVTNNLRPLVSNQATPAVKAILGNGVLTDDQSWVAYGGCAIINNFDAVQADVSNGGVRLAEFADPAGGIDQYTYSAATLYEDADTGSRVISMPYDFMNVYDDPNGAKVNSSLSDRALLLESVLAYFGVEGDPQDVSTVPGADKFAVRNYPNPFNPTTKIEYTMPRAGHLSLKIFNVRGELVKTLIDEHIESSGSIMWDGSNDSGAKVSSGVYFYEARTAGKVQVQKMALVK
jgi:hypothetical protein